MRKITLYSASSRNGGAYVDAGETLVIGDKADEISATRAKDLVDTGRAAPEAAARASDKGDTGR